MDAMTCLTTRRSVRAFRPEPLTDAQLAAVLEAGRQAPTANNLQPWQFVTVTDPARRAELKALVPKNAPFLDTAGAAVVVLGAPDAKYWLEDGCAAVTQMLAAAHALGLGGCWIAGAGKPYAEAVARFVAAPAGWKLVAIAVLGHPAGPAGTVPKRPLAELWKQERW